MTRPIKSPLAYLGVKAPNPANVIVAKMNPGNDDKYDIGTIWINESTNGFYILTSIVAGIPFWETAGSDAMTGYVVDSADPSAYTTVQAAINAAQAAGVDAVIYIRPGLTGIYTENLVLYDGLVIQGSGLETTITGVHTPPAAGIVTMYDLTLTSATDIMTSAVAGTTQILLFNCLINCTNGFTLDLPNWTGPLQLVQCADDSTINGVVNNQGGSNVTLWNGAYGAGTATDMALTGCLVEIFGCKVSCEIVFSGACEILATTGTVFGKTVTTAGTTFGNINSTKFSTGATTAISHGSAGYLILSQVTVDTTANPAIAGAGAGLLQLAGVEFIDNGNLAGTLTLSDANETRLTRILAGDNVYRTATFSSNGALIQAYGDDATVSGAASNNALLGDLTVSGGDGFHTPYAVEGRIDTIAGSDALASIAVYGYSEQTDGSVIGSTAAGVEGHLDLLETDAADLPQVYAFGVKGYLDATDTTATPAAGIFAGVGSVVEYNTPFNATAFGMAVSRLDAGAGTGTAGAAAYGVIQGTGIAADWLIGLDLYNGAAGVAYTTADIRLFNQSTIAGTAGANIFAAAAGIDFRTVLGDALGVNYISFEDSGNNEVAAIDSRGDISGRNINVTNTNIPSFRSNPVLQSIATTGAAPTGATGDYNIMSCQDGVTMEQFILGAGQTIIAPRLADDGLLMSLDLSTSEGAEYYFGHTTRAKHSFTIGTSAAFFVEATFKVADCGTSDPLWLGFRILGAPNADYTTYTDAGVIGLRNTSAADLVYIGSNLNTAGWAYVDTTDAWTDGQSHKLRVNVSAAGVVTYLIDGVAPTQTQALTFDTADVVIPFIHHLFAAGGSPAAIHISQFACGNQ